MGVRLHRRSHLLRLPGTTILQLHRRWMAVAYRLGRAASSVREPHYSIRCGFVVRMRHLRPGDRPVVLRGRAVRTRPASPEDEAHDVNTEGAEHCGPHPSLDIERGAPASPQRPALRDPAGRELVAHARPAHYLEREPGPAAADQHPEREFQRRVPVQDRPRPQHRRNQQSGESAPRSEDKG